VNITDIANTHATITGIADQIDDATEFSAANSPVQVLVTQDAWKKMRTTVEVAIDFSNTLEYAKDLVAQTFGAGSSIDPSKYLGGSVSYNAGFRPTVTAGTTNIAAFIRRPDVIKINASGSPTTDEDPLSVRNGKYIRKAMRWGLSKPRQQLAILYHGTLVIA
jgi:hypothetical protein